MEKKKHMHNPQNTTTNTALRNNNLIFGYLHKAL